MKTCENCGKAFSYRQVLLSLWQGYREVSCSRCQTLHRQATANRFLFVAVMVSCLLLALALRTFLVANFGGPLIVPLLFILLAGIASLLLPPYLTFYIREKDPEGSDLS